jgi:hypothetical protein
VQVFSKKQHAVVGVFFPPLLVFPKKASRRCVLSVGIAAEQRHKQPNYRESSFFLHHRRQGFQPLTGLPTFLPLILLPIIS